MVLLRVPDRFGLLYDERFHAGILLLNAVCEIVWPVLKQHNKTKSQDDEQDEPKKAAQERHANRLTPPDMAINTADRRQRLE
jgi:hypothetical protein